MRCLIIMGTAQVSGMMRSGIVFMPSFAPMRTPFAFPPFPNCMILCVEIRQHGTNLILVKVAYSVCQQGPALAVDPEHFPPGRLTPPKY